MATWQTWHGLREETDEEGNKRLVCWQCEAEAFAEAARELGALRSDGSSSSSSSSVGNPQRPNHDGRSPQVESR